MAMIDKRSACNIERERTHLFCVLRVLAVAALGRVEMGKKS